MSCRPLWVRGARVHQSRGCSSLGHAAIITLTLLDIFKDFDHFQPCLWWQKQLFFNETLWLLLTCWWSLKQIFLKQNMIFFPKLNPKTTLRCNIKKCKVGTHPLFADIYPSNWVELRKTPNNGFFFMMMWFWIFLFIGSSSQSDDCTLHRCSLPHPGRRPLLLSEALL